SRSPRRSSTPTERSGSRTTRSATAPSPSSTASATPSSSTSGPARLRSRSVTGPVYYHETIDVSSIREKEVEYLKVLGDVVTQIVNTPGSDMRNYAKWVLIWATGRWPQVIGQWEMTSWDWFSQHFEVFSLEVDHPAGYEQYRSGGFDRL